jgi:hypothetical protein
MKILPVVLLVIATLAASPALAKKKPPVSYDHTATMTYHDSKVRNLLDGRTDLYYSGDYTCTPGSEHFAPDCRLYRDWFHTDVVSYIEIVLENGETIVVTDSVCEAPADCQKLEAWDHEKVQTTLRRTFEDMQNPIREFVMEWEARDRSRPERQPLKDGAKKTFHYHLLLPGIIEIDPLDVLHASSR